MPEVTTAMALVTIVEKFGGWSLGGWLAFISITPAIFIYLAARLVVTAVNGLRKDLAGFKADYEDNIKFVDAYHKLVDRLEDTMRRSTIIMTKLVDRINTIKEVK